MKDTDWEILYELYRHPNITKVANLLYISQPTLTKRLQAIEAELHVKIADRMPKQIRFTREGEYLAGQAEKYMKFIQETRAGLENFKESGSKPLIVGASYTYSKYALPDLLLKYRMNHPRTEFEVINDQSNLLFRKLLEGSVDVAFIQGDYEGPVWQLKVGESRGYAVTREPVHLDELPWMPRLGYKTNDRTLELLGAWWKEYYGTEEPSGMAVGYVDVALQLAGKGLGYVCCFLPEGFQNEQNLSLTPLIRRDGSPVVRNTWFVWPKGKNIPDELEDFIGYVRKMPVSQRFQP